MSQTSASDIVLSSMTDGVVALDSQGIITGLNPAAENILGLAAEEIEGHSYAQVFFTSQENDDFNQILLDVISTHESQPYTEVTFRRADGGQRTLALTSSLLGADSKGGEILGAVLVFKDITDVHKLRRQKSRLAEELRDKHEELRQAYLKLEERNKSLEETQRRRFWIRVIAGVVTLCLFAALAVIFAGRWHRLTDSLRSEKPMAIQGEEVGGLRKFKVENGDIMLTVNSSGFIEPLDLVTIAADVSGRVIQVNVDLGQRVKEDQVLLKLNPSEVQPKVRQAESAALKAKQDLREKQNWLKRPEYKQAVRALELAQMELDRKQKRLEENEKLYKEGIIPADDLDNARSDLRRAQAEVAAAQERVATAKENGSKEKVRVAELEYQNAVAALEDANESLKRTVVRSPVEGVVMRAKSEKDGKQTDLPVLGAKVSEGQALMAVGADQPLGVQTSVDEVEVRRIHVGQKALISGQALGPKPLPGVVRSVEPQAVRENQQPVFPVMIELSAMPPDVVKTLRLGMSAAVRIVVAEAKDAVLVPIVAVSEHEGGFAVRMEREGQVVWQPVKTGISGHEFVEITEGLKPDETILY